jgi:hypothetical protein
VRIGIALVAATVVMPPVASASPTHPNYPFEFKVPASNGYRVEATATPGGSLILTTIHPLPGGGFTGASYVAKGRISQKLIRVRLGALGRISLRVKASGRHVHSTQCHHDYTYVARQATYAGKVIFNGEDGYSAVRSSRPRPTLTSRDPVGCAFVVEAFRRAPVILHARQASSGTSFSLLNNTFLGTVASALERQTVGRVKITRYIEAVVPPSAFAVNSALTVADVQNLGEPFQGSAHFQAASPGNPYGALTGSLVASFPGDASAQVAGPGFAAVLQPYDEFNGRL